MPAPLLKPHGRLNLLEIGGTQIKVPAFITIVGLEAHRRRRPKQRGTVVAPVFQVAVDRGLLEQSLGRAAVAVRRLDAKGLQDTNGLSRRQMAPLFVGGVELDRR